MRSLTKILATVAVIAFTVSAAKAGKIEDRHLSGFTSISLSASYDVYITQSNNESVKVEARDEDQPHIITDVRGGVLNIYEKNSSVLHWDWGSNKKRVVYVEVRDLNSITVTSSGDVYFKDGINTNVMRIRVTGSGDVTGKLTTKTLDASISGSGDVKLSGRADESNVRVSGSGDYSARGLATVNTAVRVMGSGDATVNASNRIDAGVSGSGDIRYTGSAKQVSTSKAGSGDIERF